MSSLEERIAAELQRVLDHQERGGFGAPPDTERGMAVGGPDEPQIVLTVEDVARIAANVARMPGLSQKPKKSREEWDAEAAARGFVSTPEGRAWARRKLAEGRERLDRTDYVQEQRDLAAWMRDPKGLPPFLSRRPDDEERT